MEQVVVDGKTMWAGKCPVPTCSAKQFTALTQPLVLKKIREHLENNLSDPIHSDISETEGWFDPDPLGD